MQLKRLEDKVAIITGAANGIGFEAARTFTREGAKVILADFDEEKGKQGMKELHEVGAKATFIKIDVADQNSVNEMVEKSVELYGKIDILINNAGIIDDAMLVDMTAEKFKRVLDVNLSGVFYCTQAVVPYMVKQSYGKIINTTSVSGVYGNVGQTNYAAAKAGIIGMTKSWAKELSKKGINVNAVAPGFTETEIVKDIPERVLNHLLQQIPQQRFGKPEDIANAYLFLASEESSYVNGHVLHVDGGIMM